MSAIDAEAPVMKPVNHDAELMHATACGDIDAFAKIVDLHKDGLVNSFRYDLEKADPSLRKLQEFFESPEWETRVSRLPNCEEIQAKLEVVQQRLEAMEKRLEKMK